MTAVLIVGATSAIAEATARLFAEGGASLCLVGRNGERLRAVADDLGTRGAKRVGQYVMDVNDIDAHARMLEESERAIGEPDICLIAHGTLPDQHACESDARLTLEHLRTNAISTIALLTVVAQVFEHRRRGTIGVISSVAGDRGRQSNYVYGTAKAALDTFLEGLRQRLHKVGVRLVTIQAGLRRHTDDRLLPEGNPVGAAEDRRKAHPPCAAQGHGRRLCPGVLAPRHARHPLPAPVACTRQ